MSFSVKDREKNIVDFQNQEFDLVIIGGGISGAGIARDAASRNMSVALIEAQDFAAGTSSRSSKLIHGGIRYLENFEFGLVFEALAERRNLFEMAPHLVHPLRFMLPIYKGGRVGMFMLGLGMWLYDVLSTFEAPELHQRKNKDETLESMPMLAQEGLAGSYVYSDAYMDDDRLVIETLRSAARGGAKAVNYVRAVGAKFVNSKVAQLVCRDELSGKEFSIKGRHFISTVGPWTDIMASQVLGDWQKIMRPSKGVHLTFQRSRLPLKEAVVMISDDEKRIVFAIPRHEMVIVGTTDTDFKGDPAEVKTTREDVDYLLHVIDEYFSGAKITEADIVASYAGVRPLVHDGSESESKTSREHLIFADPRNVTFVTGGKYTTYRKIAEDAMTFVLAQFSLEEQIRWGRGHTLAPLNPKATRENILRAKGCADQDAHKFGVDVDTVNFLVDRHGEEARDILGRYSYYNQVRYRDRWSLEAFHAIHETMCLNLKDFYLRRVPLFLSMNDHGFSMLESLAAIFQKEYSWSDEQKSAAIGEVMGHLNFEMKWRSKNA